MRKYLLVGILCLASVAAWAGVVKYNAYLVQAPGLTFSSSYALPLNGYKVDQLSFQSIASSATFTAQTVSGPAGFPTVGSNLVLSTSTFSTAVPVLYTNTGTNVSPLVAGTTYYATKVNSAFGLSTTSTAAVAGVFVTFTSSSSAGNYTFSPLPLTGTPSYKWQVSNDGINWADYTTTIYGQAVPAVTLSSYVSTGTVTSWDFGFIQYAWIRLSVTAPTAGGINLLVTGNGKNSNL